MDPAALEREATAMLPAHVVDYVRATAGGPEVLTESTAAWEAFRHRPPQRVARRLAPCPRSRSRSAA